MNQRNHRRGSQNRHFETPHGDPPTGNRVAVMSSTPPCVPLFGPPKA